MPSTSHLCVLVLTARSHSLHWDQKKVDHLHHMGIKNKMQLEKRNAFNTLLGGFHGKSRITHPIALQEVSRYAAAGARGIAYAKAECFLKSHLAATLCSDVLTSGNKYCKLVF